MGSPTVDSMEYLEQAAYRLIGRYHYQRSRFAPEGFEQTLGLVGDDPAIPAALLLVPATTVETETHLESLGATLQGAYPGCWVGLVVVGTAQDSRRLRRGRRWAGQASLWLVDTDRRRVKRAAGPRSGLVIGSLRRFGEVDSREEACWKNPWDELRRKRTTASEAEDSSKSKAGSWIAVAVGLLLVGMVAAGPAKEKVPPVDRPVAAQVKDPPDVRSRTAFPLSNRELKPLDGVLEEVSTAVWEGSQGWRLAGFFANPNSVPVRIEHLNIEARVNGEVVKRWIVEPGADSAVPYNLPEVLASGQRKSWSIILPQGNTDPGAQVRFHVSYRYGPA